MKNKLFKISIISLIIIFLAVVLYLAYVNKDYLKYKFDKNYLIIETKDVNFLNGLTKQIENKNIFVKKIINTKDLVMKKEDIKKIDSIFLANEKIKDITGIEFFINLNNLYLQGNEIKSIESLSNLKKLVILDISENRIEDYNSLSKLLELKYLNLLHNSCDDISFVENLTKLEDFSYGHLVIYKNNKSSVMGSKLDISPLEKIQNLKRLTLNGIILDTKPFLNLINLEYLNLRCKFENFSNFKNLEKLTYLNLSGSSIYDDINEKKYASDFSAFEKLISLKQLYLVNTNDLGSEHFKSDNYEDNLLKQIKNIGSLEVLDISLRLGYIDENDDYFVGLNNLKTLYVDDFGVCSLKPLEKLLNLENLFMRKNECYSNNLNYNQLKEKTKLKNVYMTAEDKKKLEESSGCKFSNIEINVLNQRGYNMQTPF